MTPETKELIMKGLSTLLSDDLARAKSAFGGLSEEEMNQQWGREWENTQGDITGISVVA